MDWRVHYTLWCDASLVSGTIDLRSFQDTRLLDKQAFGPEGHILDFSVFYEMDY